MSRPAYAQVVFGLPVEKAFTYEIPLQMRETLDVGDRVLAPFGSRLLEGFVVELRGCPPEEDISTIKPLAALLEEGSLAGLDILDLARWVASYYLASLGEVLKAAWPVGTARRAEKLFGLTDAGKRALADGLLEGPEESLARLFEADGPLSAGELRKAFRGQEVEALLKRGLEQGWFEEKIRVSPSWLAPRPRRFFSLSANVDPERLLPELRARAPLQAKLVETLAKKPSCPRSHLNRLGPGAGGALRALRKKGIVEEVLEPTSPASGQERLGPEVLPALTEPQERALAVIGSALKEKTYQAFLLHGVTGSGKTEIYLRVIAQALEAGCTACVLVPEIALTPQLVGRFEDRFPGQVAVLHSGLRRSERAEHWRRLRQGQAPICIGARSAVFSPLSDLGVIVVDEEHDSSYKQEESPRYHAREVALVRARNAKAVAILGSATPSLESRYNVERGKLTLLELPHRFEERPLPEVQVVDLRGVPSPKASPTIWSKPLEEALRRTVARGEQALLLLNRRGFANIIQCVDCGHVVTCLNCSVSLTYHAAQRAARCHWCDAVVRTIQSCSECGGGLFHYGGLGTQRVEEELKRLLPSASIARMDRDTTSRAGAYGSLLKGLETGAIDVLVGTQMIAKGHDYPNITLVGVISAETTLQVPDFRAPERTFQLLTQVAGRAGRGPKVGEVIIQTYMPDHYAIAHATRHDYAGFYQEEISRRRALGWPPFSRLALLRLEGTNGQAVEEASRELAQACREAVGSGLEGGEILGPAWAAVARVRNRFRRQVLLKHPSARRLNEWVTESVAAFRSSSRSRPSSLSLKIDIDPVSVL